eukprot:GHUV01013962.1.p1 GENE.GHUV01013962.1~~GHUV01013962.1.p1  ORF type:complete len:155 (+),score=30.11 GHUV01013962.1:260-724(+)
MQASAACRHVTPQLCFVQYHALTSGCVARRGYQQQPAWSTGSTAVQQRQRPQLNTHPQASAPRKRAETLITQAAAAAGSPPSDSVEDGSSWFTRVVCPLALVLLVCNMDRICLSVAIMPMAQEFGWPATVQGLIQSAFLWGYTAEHASPSKRAP